MDYQHGMDLLLNILQQKKDAHYNEALIYQQRLLENLRQENFFGSNETTRSERAQIVSALNQLSIKTIHIPFNDLCLGKLPEQVVVATFDLVKLRQILTKRFSLSEIKVLCFDMGIDYDELSGVDKVEKIMSLLQYIQRRLKLEDLVAYIKRSRPDVI